MNDYPLFEHENILQSLISQLRDLISKVVNHELKQFGITLRQVAVLDIVSMSGGKTTPKEISKRLLRQPNTISSLLVRMEKQGLIKRIPDPDIRTNLNISLTKKGKQLLEKSKKIDALHEISSRLSKQDLQQLIHHLKELRTGALNKLAKINGPLFPYG